MLQIISRDMVCPRCASLVWRIYSDGENDECGFINRDACDDNGAPIPVAVCLLALRKPNNWL